MANKAAAIGNGELLSSFAAMEMPVKLLSAAAPAQQASRRKAWFPPACWDDRLLSPMPPLRYGWLGQPLSSRTPCGASVESMNSTTVTTPKALLDKVSSGTLWVRLRPFARLNSCEFSYECAG
jgi:hypothetical protein